MATGWRTPLVVLALVGMLWVVPQNAQSTHGTHRLVPDGLTMD